MKLTKDVIYKYFPVNKPGEYKHSNSYVFDIADGMRAAATSMPSR